VPTLIAKVHAALADVGSPQESSSEAPTPAVSVRSSIKPDYLVCLEDGKKLKMLRRYLMTRYGMTPDDYRRKWGLPKDYPMVAP
ncbi:MucR family transcriptional regulator, partial [Pseudomonas sp. AH2 (2023)]|uniref:MucR family transcriptional regulator n=1 Tax=Pseudomonas sp. AH2 (2023) TaxID=3048599 RepID=UPI002B22EBC5